MTSKEAVKRLWQETAPATYMKDFDKKECCDVIEKDLEILDIFKDKLNIVLEDDYLSCYGGDKITEEEYEKVKEWLSDGN